MWWGWKAKPQEQTCETDLRYVAMLQQASQGGHVYLGLLSSSSSSSSSPSSSPSSAMLVARQDALPWGWSAVGSWLKAAKDDDCRLPYLRLLQRTPHVVLLMQVAKERRVEAAVAGVSACLACVAVTQITVPAVWESCTVAVLALASTTAVNFDLEKWLGVAEDPEWGSFVMDTYSRIYVDMTFSERADCLEACTEIATGRVQDYLNQRLDAYEYPEDTKTDLVLRVADGAASVATAISPFFQKWNTALKVVGQFNLLKSITPFMIGYVSLSADVGEALTDLAALMACEELAGYHIPPRQLAVGLYYLLVYRRGERGNHPTMSQQEHTGEENGVVHEEAPQSMVDTLAEYAPLAKFIYQETAADVGRMNKQFGYTLVHYEALHPARHPPFALLVSEKKKQVVVVIRGTKHTSDVLIDICAVPEKLHLSKGTFEVHKGMLRSAIWVWMKFFLSLLELKKKGYSFLMVGHSLGAGIAVFLTAMLRDSILPNLRCVAFAMPSCSDRAFAEYAESFCLTGVNGDDLVPRARTHSVRYLMNALSDPVLQARSSKDLSGDTSGLLNRLATVWAPRIRPTSKMARVVHTSAYTNLLTSDANPSLHKYVAALKEVMDGRYVNVRVLHATGAFVLEEINRKSPIAVLRSLAAAQLGFASASTAKLFVETSSHRLQELEDIETPLEDTFDLKSTPSVYVIDGDGYVKGTHQLLSMRFSEPGEEPTFLGVLSIDFSKTRVHDIAASIAAAAERTDFRVLEIWAEDESGERLIPSGADIEGWKCTLASQGLVGGCALIGRDAWGARLAGRDTLEIDTEPLRPPGEIVHVYGCCGVTKATHLRPWATALDKIEVSAKMGDDHRMDAFIRSLRALRECRKQKLEVTPWVPFSKAKICHSCSSPFSWCATSSTAASRLRSQLHCHHCGNVVCSECRNHRLSSERNPNPIPVCDTCFFELR